jgi:hypothetical protein
MLTPFFFLVMSNLGDDDSETLKAISSAYAANWESIDRGKATFVVTEGKAADADAARRGEIPHAVKSTGRYNFSKNNMLYEHIYRDEDVIKNTIIISPKETAPIYLPVLMMTDGTSSFIDLIGMSPADKLVHHRGHIKKGTNDFDEKLSFPLTLGLKRLRVGTLALDLDDARRGAGAAKSFVLQRDVEYEGRGVVQVTISFGETERVYWIDREHGCIPLQIIERTCDQINIRTTNYDWIERVGEKSWLPMRQIRYYYPGGWTKVFEITKFTSDVNKDKTEFTLSFPEPITIIDAVNELRYEKKRTLALSEFTSPSRDESRPIHINKPMPRVKP